MSTQPDSELKKDLPAAPAQASASKAGKAGFQLERIILFSDAVFENFQKVCFQKTVHI